MKLKRNPGEWLQEKMLDRAIDAALLWSLGYGWLCGAVLTLLAVFGTRLFLESTPLPVLLTSVLPGLLLLVCAWYTYKDGWQLQNMRKGKLAEQIIGQKIEYALTRDACAVAHNVKKVAQHGDIDHLVATPHGLWVIETKSGFLRNDVFQKTLGTIATNVKNVRKWAPEDTRVTGCLVFANEPKNLKKLIYEKNNEKIRVFKKREVLIRELRKEARETGDSWELADRVWKLGKLETADQPERPA